MSGSVDGYRSDIDGLRAVAVFSVVAYHAGVPFLGGGFVGVDIFFAISGYLIGGIIDRDVRAGRFSFAGFYARRAKRILPALLGILLFCYGAASLLLSPVETRSLARGAAATILAVSNIVFRRELNYFSPTAELNPLLMTWSLAVEEQFYLFFPIVLMALERLMPRRVFSALLVLSLGSFAASVWGAFESPTAAFFLLPTRAWELSGGALLAVYEARRGPIAAGVHPAIGQAFGLGGLGLILAAILAYDDQTLFPGPGAIPPVLGALLLLAARGGLVNRLLSSRPFVFLGLISYSWYLWHWPLLAFARIASDRDLGVGAGIGIAIVSCAAGYLSWRYIELPFRRSGTPRRAMLWRYAAAIVVFLAPALALFESGGWPQRFPQALGVIEAEGGSLAQDPCLVSYGAAEPNLSDFCAPPADARPAMAMLGDSHGAALSDALRRLLDRQGMRFVELTKSSCPALAGISRAMPSHPGHREECAAFSHRAIDYIEADPTIKTVVIAGFWSANFTLASEGVFARDGEAAATVSQAASRDNLGFGIDAVVARLEGHGKRVVLAKDIPMFDFDPLRRTIANFIPLRHRLVDLLSPRPDLGAGRAPSIDVTNLDDPSSAIIDRVAAGHPAVQVVDLKRSLCTAGSCRFATGQDIYYVDFQHLSEIGAMQALAGVRIAQIPLDAGGRGAAAVDLR